MQILEDPQSIKEVIGQFKCEGKQVGLVPTMGALHEGHIQLIRRSISRCNATVVSIFVNPLQFNKKEDLDNYPRTLEADIALLRELNVDFLFNPSLRDFYFQDPRIFIDFGDMDNVLEGKYRPGHFKGVGIAVAKLLNIIQPDYAFFGEKDLQQYLLIKQMVKDLSFNVIIEGVPTARNADGLAMSSRNMRLTPAGKSIAAGIYRGLKHATTLIEKGTPPAEVKRSTLEFYGKYKGLYIEYLEITNNVLNLIESYEDQHFVAICVAAQVEGIRLIDNIYLRLGNGN